jgi:hypothetical protein
MEYVYFGYAGSVERGPKYQLRNGYARISDDGNDCQPWSTKREAQSEAKADGRKALFFESIEDAQEAQKADA